MKAKLYFQQVATAEKELKMIRAQIRHYEDLGYSISGCSSEGLRGPKSGRNASKVELSAIGIADATETLRSREKAYAEIILKAQALISKIQQEKYRQILTYRYLCGWSFRSISDELEYKDQRSIYRAHGWALREAQKILNRTQQKGGQPDG